MGLGIFDLCSVRLSFMDSTQLCFLEVLAVLDLEHFKVCTEHERSSDRKYLLFFALRKRDPHATGLDSLAGF
jgi:hypothetical protein